MRPLHELLASVDEDAWPEILVLEFPVHLALSTRGMRTVADVFTDWAPPRATTVASQKAWRVWKPKGGGGRRWARIAALPAGRLAHSGDGSVSVRLRGTVEDRADLLVDVAGSKLEYTWLPGRGELVLPLMGDGASSGTVTVSVRAKKARALELEGVEAVAAVRAAPLARGEVLRAERQRGKRWVQEVRFADRPVLPEHGVLRLALAPKAEARGPQGRVELEVLVDDETEPARRFAFRRLVAGGCVAVGLDGLAGRRLAAARLVGEGRPPEPGVATAALHEP